MRYLTLTDIHANLEALDAVLADARSRGYDETLVLGDVIGYGPDPDGVVARVQELKPLATIRGNHDKVALGLYQADGFNVAARTAAAWTLNHLSPKHRQWVAALPQGPVVVDDLIEICHGAPFDEDAYILDELEALRALRASTRPLCIFGHTHQPRTCQLARDTLECGRAEVLELKPGVKYLCNPGSVGQPRDGDPRAAYAIVDVDALRVEMIRVSYPINVTQEKMKKARLPEPLIRRLAAGR